MDRLSMEDRSRLMSKIVGDNLGPEIAVRSVLDGLGFVYERNSSRLPGRPDFVLLGRKTAVFVHGCFWHGCPVHFKEPKSRQEFWREKIRRNRERDSEVTASLSSLGWTVLVVWEHDVKLGVQHLRSLLSPSSSSPSAPLRSRTGY